MPSSQPTASPFDLPERLHRKATPALIGRDEEQFAAMHAALASERERVRHRLDDRAVAHIYALLDALLRRERCIVEDHQGRPRLI